MTEDFILTKLSSENIASEKSYIEKLVLYNFRNHNNLVMELNQNPVLIVGPNGSGKTNILEAISLFSPGKGLRGASSIEIANNQNPSELSWSVFVIANSDGIEKELQVYTQLSEENKLTKLTKFDGQNLSSHEELLDFLPVLWLTPQMNNLFINPAKDRRKFLSRLCFNFFPTHATFLLNYEKLMRQRAKMLKDQITDQYWLNSVELQMAQESKKIADQRAKTLEMLQNSIDQTISPFPKAILGIASKLEEKLVSSAPDEAVEYLASELAKSRRLDSLTKRTNTGIHLSDMLVYDALSGQPSFLCSTGQQKALLMSIILAQVKAKKMRDNIAPILLLDEACTHLDEQRREYLFNELAQSKVQYWITATEQDMLPKFDEAVNIIKL